MNGTIKWLAASSILHTFAAPTSLKGLPSMTSKYFEIMLGNLLGNLTPSRQSGASGVVGALEVGVTLESTSQLGWMCCLSPHGRCLSQIKYGAADFNGGNQLVGTDGRVTIRVQAPSAYYETSWISVPHVHLRVCSNDTYAHATGDAIVFMYNGPELYHPEDGSNFQVLSFKNMS